VEAQSVPAASAAAQFARERSPSAPANRQKR